MEGIIYGGKFAFREIDWVSLIVGSKFTFVFLCFTLYLRAIFQVQAPGGLYLERRFNGGVFALRAWGAYISKGLFSEFYGTERIYGLSKKELEMDFKKSFLLLF